MRFNLIHIYASDVIPFQPSPLRHAAGVRGAENHVFFNIDSALACA